MYSTYQGKNSHQCLYVCRARTCPYNTQLPVKRYLFVLQVQILLSSNEIQEINILIIKTCFTYYLQVSKDIHNVTAADHTFSQDKTGRGKLTAMTYIQRESGGYAQCFWHS